MSGAAEGKKAASTGGGSIDNMPDGVLEHILGYLPAEDAVQTCVLAKRWRHLWKSAAGLGIGCRNEARPGPVAEYREFVNRLLLLRGGSPLETFELRLGKLLATDETRPLNNCVWQDILCKARVLKVFVLPEYSLALDNLPFISHHLTRAEQATSTPAGDLQFRRRFRRISPSGCLSGTGCGRDLMDRRPEYGV